MMLPNLPPPPVAATPPPMMVQSPLRQRAAALRQLHSILSAAQPPARPEQPFYKDTSWYGKRPY